MVMAVVVKFLFAGHSDDSMWFPLADKGTKKIKREAKIRGNHGWESSGLTPPKDSPFILKFLVLIMRMHAIALNSSSLK